MCSLVVYRPVQNSVVTCNTCLINPNQRVIDHYIAHYSLYQLVCDGIQGKGFPAGPVIYI